MFIQRSCGQFLKPYLKKMRVSTESYIDDILVDETVVPASKLVSHLYKFGLIGKSLGSFERAAALGLWLDKDRASNLVFTRGNEISEVHEKMSRHSLLVVNWWGTIQLLDGLEPLT